MALAEDLARWAVVEVEVQRPHRRQVAHHEEGGEGGVKEEGDPLGGRGWDAQAAHAGRVGCREVKEREACVMDCWSNVGKDVLTHLKCDNEQNAHPTKMNLSGNRSATSRESKRDEERKCFG